MSTVLAGNAEALVDVTERTATPSLRDVFCQHGAFVVRVVQRMGVRPADVEDVAQDVFVVAHRKLAQFDGRCAIRSWLFGIVLRVVSDYRRRAPNRREVLTVRPPEPATGRHEAEMHTQVAALETALGRLDVKHRAVFVLYELEGLPMDQVAESVGCPLFTAYTRLRTARRRVLAELGQDEARESDHG